MALSHSDVGSAADISSQIVDGKTLEWLFQRMFGRPIGNDQWKSEHSLIHNMDYWLKRILNSDEFRDNFIKNNDQIILEVFEKRFPDAFAFSLSEKSSRPLRILLLGSCQIEPVAFTGRELGYTVLHRLAGGAPYEEVPETPAGEFDAAILAPSLRAYLRAAIHASGREGDMVLARIKGKDEVDALIAAATSHLQHQLSSVATSLQGTPLFVMSFFEPSFNYEGDLINPFKPDAPRTVIRRLNEALADVISSIPGLYYIESNDILNYIGRAHIQDDIFGAGSHASYLGDGFWERDRTRLIVPDPIHKSYKYEEYMRHYSEILLHAIQTRLDIIEARQPVKLVIVDLDDTLWRGVAAEEELEDWERVEGWPTGLIEALLFLKKRGCLLAISSKNDRETTLQRLQRIWAGAITVDDFTSIKINWNPKSDNIEKILKETNILPQNALFIDDNPREIDEVKARFPQMRFLNDNLYVWRQMLLRLPEMQVMNITEESERRTEMVQARIERLEMKNQMSRKEWLRSLELQQNVFVLDPNDKPRFDRAFELINKTNQFNTTGKRWELFEFQEFLTSGGKCLLTSLKDKTTDNGVIGVTLISNEEIVQAVLSCRVFGLGAELVMGAEATRIALTQAPKAIGRIIDTGRNLTCHNWFTSLGFINVGDHFETESIPSMPEWIMVTSIT